MTQPSIDDALENIDSVRNSIRSVKGEAYLTLVEIVACSMRRKDLHEKLLIPILRFVRVPPQMVHIFLEVSASHDARMIALAANLSGLDLLVDDSALGKELIAWAERLVRVEQESILSAVAPELRKFLESGELPKGGEDGADQQH